MQIQILIHKLYNLIPELRGNGSTELIDSNVEKMPQFFSYHGGPVADISRYLVDIQMQINKSTLQFFQR